MNLQERLAAISDESGDSGISNEASAPAPPSAPPAQAPAPNPPSMDPGDERELAERLRAELQAGNGAAQRIAADAARSAGQPSLTSPGGGEAPPRDRRREDRPDKAPTPGRRSQDEALLATKRKVRELVLEEVAPRIAGLDSDALATEVRAALDRIIQREDVKVSPVQQRMFVDEMIADTLGHGPLEPLLRDDTVSEIMCNAYDDIWIERKGQLVEAAITFTDDDHYRKVIERIVSAVGRRVDESSPMVDARLADGSRVNAIIPPLALKGSVLTIRKFAADPLTAMDLVDMGTYTIDLVTVLDACVRGKLNMLVSGGTGTGKTTNLNVMSSFIPDGERILTIEDSAELQLQQRHVVSLETRPPNAEGEGEVSIRDLVKNALRMRPDRIIVGECRAAEALDMLQAMNTGHEGSMTTVHANTPRDALSRLETMVLMAGYDLPVKAIREQIGSAIDVILQVERLPSGRRVVSALSEVQGLEGDTILMQDIFRFRMPRGPEDKGGLESTGLRPAFAQQIREKGVVLPASVFRPPALAPAPPPGTRRAPVRVPDEAALADRELER